MKSSELQLLETIRTFLAENRNPAVKEKYARYFVEGYDPYGTDQKLLEQERQKWFSAYDSQLGLDGFLNLGDLLVASGKYEEMFLAFWFVTRYPQHLSPAVFPRMAAWLENGICNWAMVDSFSMDVCAPFLLKKVVGLDALAAWRRSPSKWMRRAAAVTLIRPGKNGLPAAEILEFIRPIMLDEEKVVRQGLGWLLRELWKIDRAPVEDFLLEYKDTCGRLIIQYATEKMTAEEKARFKRTSGKAVKSTHLPSK
jgi:3-methyladenine DNA glycosylase AlkD